MKNNTPTNFHKTIIIGAGFSGLCAAIRLQKENRNDFIILERATELGGTWRDNTYPGCGCDVPSRLYSLAAEPNPNWSRAFSKQPEILAYMQSCAKKNDLYKKIHFNTEVNALKFEEAKGIWHVKTNTGKELSCRFILSATGPLNRIIIPDFNSLDDFKGDYFHSSQWPENFDLKGRRVAVIGTGASAIQVVPNIVDRVEKLVLFQRSAAWIMPKRDKEISAFSKQLYRSFPFLEKMARGLFYYFHEIRGNGFWGNTFTNNTAQKIALHYLKQSVPDPELREKLTPNYALGCKRVLPSDDYYPALQRPNASLVTTGIDKMCATGILTKDGQLHEVDTIVFATGFRASGDLVDYPVAGRNGLKLKEEWDRTGIETLRGIAVSGFPHLLFLLGPNTGLGHNSVLLMIEAQMNYVVDYMRQHEQLGAKYLDVKREEQEVYNQKIQEELQGTIWASGCKSWYLDKHGKNTTLWPSSVARYRKETKQIRLEEFEQVP